MQESLSLVCIQMQCTREAKSSTLYPNLQDGKNLTSFVKSQLKYSVLSGLTGWQNVLQNYHLLPKKEMWKTVREKRSCAVSVWPAFPWKLTQAPLCSMTESLKSNLVVCPNRHKTWNKKSYVVSSLWFLAHWLQLLRVTLLPHSWLKMINIYYT